MAKSNRKAGSRKAAVDPPQMPCRKLSLDAHPLGYWSTKTPVSGGVFASARGDAILEKNKPASVVTPAVVRDFSRSPERIEARRVRPRMCTVV